MFCQRQSRSVISNNTALNPSSWGMCSAAGRPLLRLAQPRPPPITLLCSSVPALLQHSEILILASLVWGKGFSHTCHSSHGHPTCTYQEQGAEGMRKRNPIPTVKYMSTPLSVCAPPCPPAPNAHNHSLDWPIPSKGQLQCYLLHYPYLQKLKHWGTDSPLQPNNREGERTQESWLPGLCFDNSSAIATKYEKTQTLRSTWRSSGVRIWNLFLPLQWKKTLFYSKIAKIFNFL